MTQVHVVIPARYNSSRLMGKPLMMIGNKPMVQHVYENAKKAFSSVVVATDCSSVRNAAVAFGAEAIITPDCDSGTDRVAIIAEQMGWGDDDIIINLQGDEPLLLPQLLVALAQELAEQDECKIATIVSPVKSLAEFVDVNVVKAVIRSNGVAQYFSRSPIPYPRCWVSVFNADKVEYDVPNNALKHVGIYAYRKSALLAFSRLSQRSGSYESVEMLEQLRAIECGMSILCITRTDVPELGVDTAGDLDRVREIMECN
ncbi:3-deoxy-manno-octulosonate cytidylyltransferase [Vibrio sp. PNB22_3_1]